MAATTSVTTSVTLPCPHCEVLVPVDGTVYAVPYLDGDTRTVTLGWDLAWDHTCATEQTTPLPEAAPPAIIEQTPDTTPDAPTATLSPEQPADTPTDPIPPPTT